MSSHCNINLKKSKSVGTLSVTDRYMQREENLECFCDYFGRDNHSQSVSSRNICVIIDDGSEISVDRQDSGAVKIHDEGLTALDHKITKLNHMLQEQHSLLKALKDEIVCPKFMKKLTKIQPPDLLTNSTNASEELTKLLSESTLEDTKVPTDCLLETIKVTQIEKIDREIRESLIEFLKSDDLKTCIASATSETVKEVISKCFSETFPSSYLPVMEESHRKLLTHVTKTLESAFNELEAGSSSLFKTVHKTSRSLRVALEKHQVLVETNKSENIFENFQGTLEMIMKNELKEWREKVLGVIKPQLQTQECEEAFPTFDTLYAPPAPPSPPQPADPERSIIDQLMKSAQINKQIKDGDINESFEEALSSGELSLVMSACRAAQPQRVFSPCALSQPVLLSLVQQLATDMLHDTQLKCRYLEDALINLKTTDPTTRAYLPLVVGEVRKHLTKFLKSFPSHVASRRITLIVMAANNLLK